MGSGSESSVESSGSELAAVLAGEQDAEKVRQRRSRFESLLNVPQRVRLRGFLQLRPCWTAFLSILQRWSILVVAVHAIEIPLGWNGFSAAY